MNTHRPLIDLGFTAERFPAGVHICQSFTDDEERENALFHYLLSGINSGERTACFSDKATAPQVDDFLGRQGRCYAELSTSGLLTLSATEHVYFRDERFDPDRMVEVLTQFHDESIDHGYRAARVIGEMSPAVRHVPETT